MNSGDNVKKSDENTCTSNPKPICPIGVIPATPAACYCGAEDAVTGDHCDKIGADAKLTKKCGASNCTASSLNCNVKPDETCMCGTDKLIAGQLCIAFGSAGKPGQDASCNKDDDKCDGELVCDNANKCKVDIDDACTGEVCITGAFCPATGSTDRKCKSCGVGCDKCDIDTTCATCTPGYEKAG